MSASRSSHRYFEHASRAIKGSRHYQEDYCDIVTLPAAEPSDAATAALQPEALLAVLADGMGGHAGGDVASSTACKRFLSAYMENSGKTGTRLLRALQASREAIAEKVSEDRSLLGMGCTLIGALFAVDGLRWVSVGDSLILLYRQGTLQRLNEDHSLAPCVDDLARQGKLTMAEARTDPRRHLLTSYVGADEIEKVDLRYEPFPLLAGDCVIVASDGIESLGNNEIAQILEANRHSTAERIAEALIAAVEQAGNPYQDNATLVVVRPRSPSSAVGVRDD